MEISVHIVLIYQLFSGCLATSYVVDDSVGLGRIFDGIGGLSAGASSKFLVSYKEPQRSEILDYLFKPNFGASLQILKVEIGGDAQSTEGTEASHMHSEWDENYSRGYEWWLMTEAKKRNPNIKLYGLPWGFPGWLGKGSTSPYKDPSLTVSYIIKWIFGARKYYNLTIDFIGIWNERPYNVDYIITLRVHLDLNGLQHVQIIAPDGSWGISKDIIKNATLKESVYAIGAHYPGTKSSFEALKTGLKLWASEDYSTFNDNIGAGCWARLLNQNYVNGNITSTITWSPIAAYYNNLPFPRCALMTAMEPWSGNYVVNNPIWVTAHTTQFTNIGWTYLKHGSGTGKLSKGGSYVSLISPDKKDFTMVIETMTHNHSVCIRPPLSPYNVSSQSATFKLGGSLEGLTSLHVWYSKLGFGGSETIMMKQQADIKPSGRIFTLNLIPDAIYTLSTVSTAAKGQHPTPPASKPLDLPYYDNFDKYPEQTEAYNFAPQFGSFETMKSPDSTRGMINRQTVLEAPIFWCEPSPFNKSIIIGGNYNWSDVTVSIDAYVPSVNGTDGVFLAARLDQGGCHTSEAQGIFLWMYPDNQTYELTEDFAQKKILKQGKTTISRDKWFTITFSTESNKVTLDAGEQNTVITLPLASSTKGFIGYGTHSYGAADFDNFKVEKPLTSLANSDYLLRIKT